MNIALIGYGRMGKTIEKLAMRQGYNITMRIDSTNQKDLTREHLLSTKTDVAIEFTHPEVAYDNIHTLLSAGVAVVSGTTGWLDRWDEIKDYAQSVNGTLLYASNFSIGVNIFFELNRQLAQMMNAYATYQPTIHEIHHTGKKDAPSGTAISLGEDIITHIDALKNWANDAVTSSETLSITSQRVDDNKGTHHVKYESSIDEIEIVHRAKSREGFAHGALLAAGYVHNKRGIYTMKDVLGL